MNPFAMLLSQNAGSLFDADPNTPGVQIFNTNPNRNVTSNQNILNTNVSNSIPTTSSFSMGNLPKNRRSLLRDSFNYQNPFRGDEMTGSFQNVGNAVTSRFGGGTIANPTYPNASILNQRAKVQNNQNNTGLMTQPNTGFASQGQELASQGLLNQQGQQRQTNQEPKQKGLLQKDFDKAMDFATSDYGRDFFTGIDAGYSKMPKTFMQSIQPGIQYAEAKKQQDIKNEINRIRAKKENYREPVYRGLVVDRQGNEYGLFSSKGGLYAEVGNERVPQNKLKDIIGPYELRTLGQQTFGIDNASAFGELDQELTTDENTLNAYTNYLVQLGDTNTGVKRIVDEMLGHVKTLAGIELTTSELQRILADGSLQRLIGGSRTEIVGPGVMTEQDAFRIIKALGGDVDALQNPTAVKKVISQIFSEKYRNYEKKRQRYNIQVKNQYGNLGYEEKPELKLNERQIKSLDVNTAVKTGFSTYGKYNTQTLTEIFNSGDWENIPDDLLPQFFDELVTRGIIPEESLKGFE